MSFKDFYKQQISEVPHVDLKLFIDFEAEKSKTVEKLVRLFKSLEDWQKSEVTEQILGSHPKFYLYVRNELKVMEELKPDKYKEAIQIIPKELQ